MMAQYSPFKSFIEGTIAPEVSVIKPFDSGNQCDQIWQFFGLWATF